jgi:hypothetical protein
MFVCGTVNHTRKKHTMKDDKELNRGDFDWKTTNFGISAFKWKDTRTVHLLSNYHNLNDRTSVRRKEKNGNLTEVPCPQILVDYGIC